MWVLERGLIFSSLRLGSIALDFSKHVASLSLFNAAAQAHFFFLFSFFPFEARRLAQPLQRRRTGTLLFSFSFFFLEARRLAQPL